MMEVFMKKDFTVEELFNNHIGKNNAIEIKEFQQMAEIYFIKASNKVVEKAFNIIDRNDEESLCLEDLRNIF
jgi:Ca2+-binding EF-hand superfamily protein